MALLDELSGFEFEDLMEDVFRNLGYENVRQSTRTGDEGRDIIMEEVVDGRRRTVIVECKHTRKVSRPVVQKLHSAVSTFHADGPKRGMVVTTGEFTDPAREYAQKVNRNSTGPSVELLDGQDLREIGDEIGLDLYNGRIEIICDEMFRATDPTGRVDEPVREAFQDIRNIDARQLPGPVSQITLDPVLAIQARVDAVFETSVGVIHQINQQDRFVLRADRGSPELLDDQVRRLVDDNRHATIDVDEDRLAEQFDVIERKRFGQTETEYKEWAVDRLQRHYTTTVNYTGDNNVDYSKECEPNLSDISVQHITPVYLPQIRQVTSLQGYNYPLAYYAAGPSRVTLKDGIHRCIQCDQSGSGTYTYCENCGSINCKSHIKTERLADEPVCTGCAVTERFALKKKYFYDEEKLEQFREQYDQMPIHRKAMENPALVAGTALTVVAAIILFFVMIGGLIGLV